MSPIAYWDDLSASELEAVRRALEAMDIGASTGPAGYDIWLLAGQSNMDGQGANYDARTDPSDPRVWVYMAAGGYVNKITLAVEPIGNSLVGPGMTFARWHAETIPGRKILLVPAAVNGTAFEVGEYRWKVKRPADQFNLFETAVTRCLAAKAAAGEGARIAGVLWLQGESDAIANIPAATYRADLLELIDAMRNRFDDFELPFIVARHVAEFRTSSAAATAIDGVFTSLPTARAFTACAVSPGVGFQLGDNLHYNLEGQHLLGRGYADAVPDALANTSAPPTLAAVVGVPDAVTNLLAAAGDGSITLAWIAPASNGAGLNDYIVQQRVGAGSWTTAADGTSTATTATITGLTNDTVYDFRVAAVNSVGQGPFSESTQGTPVAAPTGGGGEYDRDTLTRADAGTLGQTAGGRTWSTLFGPGVGIAGNKAAASARSAVTIPGPGQKQSVTYTVGAIEDTHGGVILRATNTNDIQYYLLFENGGSLVVFVSLGVNTLIALNGANNAGPVVQGDVLTFAVDGFDFTITKNGQQVGAFTDSTLPANGDPGIWLGDSAARISGPVVFG